MASGTKRIRVLWAEFTALGLVWLFAVAKVSAQGTDPLSILKASFAAANAGDVAAALAFYGDDAVLVNTRGARFSGKDSIRKFLQANVEHKVQAHVQNLSPQIHGETVTLTDKYTTEFFERWGVGYVEFKTDVVVREGKIKSQINYITFEGLMKIKLACDTPQGLTVAAGTSRDDFLRRAMAQTENVLGFLRAPNSS